MIEDGEINSPLQRRNCRQDADGRSQQKRRGILLRKDRAMAQRSRFARNEVRALRRGFCGPAAADLGEKFAFVLLHQADEGAVFGLFVAAGPQDHFGEDRS